MADTDVQSPPAVQAAAPRHDRAMTDTKKGMLISLGLAAAAAFAFGGAAATATAPMATTAYQAALKRIDQQGKADRKACKRLEGNARDVCEAQARGDEEVARARLRAQHEPSPEAEKLAKFSEADAEYEVAKVRCDAARPWLKDSCRERAKAAHEAAIRLAKVEKVQEVNALKRAAEAQRQAARQADPDS